MEWWKEASLAVLMLVMVLALLRHLAGERVDRRLTAAACHEAHRDARQTMEKVVDRNTDMLATNIRVLGRVDQAVRKFNGEDPSPITEETKT